MKSSLLLLFLATLFIPGCFCLTHIEQISEITTVFNKSFRQSVPNTQNTVELIIAASADLNNDFSNLNTYLHCLGSTKLEIESVGSDSENGLKIAVADSLVEVRDKLQQQMPNKVWSFIKNTVKNEDAEDNNNLKLPVQKLKLTLSPYQEKYVAISSKHPIRVIATRSKLHMNSVLFLLFGVWLFIYSPEIAKQAAFYYVSGVSVSVVFGALIMMYFLINRLIPKRDSILVVGLLGSVGVWVEWFFNGFLRQTVFGLLKQNWIWVAGYFLIFGGGGFVYCYIKGPPTENPRAHNVLKVLLWLIASGFIVGSFNLTEIGFGVLGFVVISWCFYPKSDDKDGEENIDFGGNRFSEKLEEQIIRKTQGKQKFKGLLESNNTPKLNKPVTRSEKRSSDSDKFTFTPIPQHTFPEKPNSSFIATLFKGKKQKKTSEQDNNTPTRRHLTENEYLSQGIDCTQTELNKLRMLMDESQDGSPWRYVQKLQNPKRFAEFVTGSPHVSQIELSAYEEDLDSIISDAEMKSKYSFEEEEDGKDNNDGSEKNDSSSDSEIDDAERNENGENINQVDKGVTSKKAVASKNKVITAKTPTSLPRLR